MPRALRLCLQTLLHRGRWTSQGGEFTLHCIYLTHCWHFAFNILVKKVHRSQGGSHNPVNSARQRQSSQGDQGAVRPRHWGMEDLDWEGGVWGRGPHGRHPGETSQVALHPRLGPYSRGGKDQDNEDEEFRQLQDYYLNIQSQRYWRCRLSTFSIKVFLFPNLPADHNGGGKSWC